MNLYTLSVYVSAHKIQPQAFDGEEERKHSEIADGEEGDILSGLFGIMLCIFAEGDQAGKGGNEGTRTADIHTEKKLTVVIGKLREKDGTGDVADDLAGERADKERIFFKQPLEKCLDQGNSCHISRKHEECAEGKKQRVIDLFQCVAVKEHKRERHEDKTDLIGDHAKDDDHREREERKIDRRAAAIDDNVVILDRQGLGLDENETAGGDDRDGNREGQRHNAHEFAGGDIELGIYVKVLRIAKGREHTAEVCGDILHDERKRHVFLLLCRLQNHKSKRQEREKRHIVGKEHRPDEGDVDERQHTELRVFAKPNDPACQRDEEFHVAKCANAGERAEKTGQRLEIEITEIFGIGRNGNGRDDCRADGDRKHGIGAQKIAYCRGCRMKECAKRRCEVPRFFGMNENVMSSDRMCHFKNLPVLRLQTDTLYHT